MPSPSLSHVTPAPAMAMAPSKAYSTGRSGPSWNATVVRRPWAEGTAVGPVFRRRKPPVP